MLRSRRLWLVMAGLAVVAAIGVALFLILRPKTLLDTGPLDLPGVPHPPAAREEVLLAVGDVGDCGSQADERVAALAAELPGRIAMLGDSVYPAGSADNLEECLAPAWDPLLDRVRPVPGNHDYVNGRADAYFSFFGDAAGRDGEGWYSYSLGAWHVIALNSIPCFTDAGCGPGTAEYDWLVDDLRRADLADADCLLAYWHHPLLSSGRHGPNPEVQPIWSVLADAGLDVTLHGHDHSYERLEIDGVTSFVVGTGGRSLYLFERDPLPETQVRHDSSYGLLYLVLGERRFTWEFLPLGATTFTDSGEGDCG